MPDLDTRKGRLIQLGFKKATEGLTPEEIQEMAKLQRELALEKAQGGN